MKQRAPDEFDECSCGHLREEHAEPNSPACSVIPCGCFAFKLEFHAEEIDEEDDDDDDDYFDDEDDVDPDDEIARARARRKRGAR